MDMRNHLMVQAGLGVLVLCAAVSACNGGRSDTTPISPGEGGDNDIVVSDSAMVSLSILPAGSNGNSAGAIGGPVPGQPQLVFPENYRDQLDLYGNLAQAQPGLQSQSCVAPNSIAEHAPASTDACNYYKPAGLRPVPGSVVSTLELTASNGSTVNIERDGWGVPYILGEDRFAAQFGMGYASAQDRLWLWDLLRDVGRGEASRKLGPARTTFDLDLEFGVPGGYSEAELQRIVDDGVAKIGPLGQTFLADTEAFVAGMNAYLEFLQTPAGLAEIPLEYVTLGLQVPTLFPPRPFTITDIVANAVLIQSALGLGGGGEARNVQLLQKLDASIGAGTTTLPQAACDFWRDIRHAQDPEHTQTTNEVFATQSPPTVSEECPQQLPAGVALWDAGTLEPREFLRRDAGTPIPIVDLGGVPVLGEALDALLQPVLAPLPDEESETVPIGGGGGLTANEIVPSVKSSSQSLLAHIDPSGIRERLAPLGMPLATSNFVLAGGAQTQSGRPIMVAGPQTGYFQPQLLWEAAVVSTGGTDNDIAVRGITTVNIPYISIGRGRDFAWSPTSASSDFTDIRVSRLCNTDGSAASRADGDGDGFPDADGYVFNDTCVRLYRRTDNWTATPTPASLALGGPTGAEEISRFILRTHYGPVLATAEVDGEPVVISSQRSTFMADVDAVIPFATMANNGERMNAERFFELFNSMTSTFNWSYVDRNDIGFIQSGLYPQRHPEQHPELPVWGDGRFEWVVDQGLNEEFFATYGGEDSQGGLSFPSRARPVPQGSASGRAGYFEWPGYIDKDSHVHAVNPPEGYLANWNNNGAPGWWAADTKTDYGASHRVNMLAARMDAFQASGRKHDLASVIEVAADAAFADLRAQDLVPLLIEMLQTAPLSEEEQAIVELMQAWNAEGSQRWINGEDGLGGLRRDRDNDGAYDRRAAVVFMDAWYQRLIDTMLPQLTAVEGPVIQGRYDAPGPVGSAYQGGWFQFMVRVLRTALQKPDRTDYRVLRCANSEQASDCRAAVATALSQALDDLGGLSNQANWDGSQLYDGTIVEDNDAVLATAFGFQPVPPIHWTNRPTFQQVFQMLE